MLTTDINSEVELQQALQKLSEHIRQNQLHYTKEREEVLKYIYTHTGHLEADEITKGIAETGFRVSRMSVYNILEFLTKCQLIACHHFNNGAATYEKFTPHTQHFHRICCNCGSVKEFSDKKLLRTLRKKNFTAFSPSYFSFYIYGLCKKCQKELEINNHK
ncbi:MAG: Fur family transcriptional regulator [Bacteroidales bacterium]|nr:Fur family transcriptional regulator [Bacteroidales bacterium]